DVDPWYRWPSSVLSASFFPTAILGVVTGLRRTPGTAPTDLLRRRFTLLALSAAALAVLAVYVPTQSENRYALPMFPLLAAPFVLGVGRMAAAVRTTSAARLSLGALAVVVWLG